MSDPPDYSLALKYGITDRASGIAKATEARVRMTDLAARVFGDKQELDVPRMTLMSLLTRAQAFHDGTLDAARSDNPFASFTLLRSYAENAAILIRVSEKQGEIRPLYPGAPVEQKFSIGKLLAYAENGSGGFAGIYSQLSGFAHPSAATALSGWRTTDEHSLVSWKSTPRFKTEGDFMLACVWLIELADANAQLWALTWTKYFGPNSEWDAPGWPETGLSR